RRLQASLVIGSASCQFPVFPQGMLVTEIEVLVVIEIQSSRIVEHGTEVSRGDSLIARTEHALKRESTKRNCRQDMLKAFVVGVAGNSVVGGGTVELGIEQSLPLAIVESAGEQDADPSV